MYLFDNRILFLQDFDNVQKNNDNVHYVALAIRLYLTEIHQNSLVKISGFFLICSLFTYAGKKRYA